MDTYTPIVYLEIGGKQMMTIPPKYIQEFDYEDNCGSGGDRWSVRIIDPDGDIVEKLIVSHGIYGEVKLSWGWIGGAFSEVKKAMILAYTPTFRYDLKTDLRISGVDQGTWQGQYIQRNQSWQGKEIHEIVEEICKRNGWKCVVEPAETIYSKDYSNTGLDEPQSFIQTQETDLQFLRRLAQFAKSKKDGRVDYKVWFENGDTLHFRPPDYMSPPKRRYVIGAKNSNMLSFSPDIIGILMMALGSSIVSGWGMDIYTGEDFSITKTDDNTPNKVNLNVKTEGMLPLRKGDVGNTGVFPYRVRKEAETRLEDIFTGKHNIIFNANAEIIGDPGVEGGDIVNIKVITSTGKVHYTSGNYFVLSAHHIIRGGVYTTTLSLLTNAFKWGSKDVVGHKNPGG